MVLQESLFADADYMESNLGFTYDTDKYSDLPALVTDLHSRGQRYMIVLVRLGYIWPLRIKEAFLSHKVTDTSL